MRGQGLPGAVDQHHIDIGRQFKRIVIPDRDIGTALGRREPISSPSLIISTGRDVIFAQADDVEDIARLFDTRDQGTRPCTTGTSAAASTRFNNASLVCPP